MKKAIVIVTLVLAVFMALLSCKKNESPTTPAATKTPVVMTATNTATVTATATATKTPFSCIGVIHFPDANLEARIRQALNIPTPTPIYGTDLANLTYLDASVSNITDITGLQCCTSLTNLYLGSNNISDISALSGLTSLTDLDLGYNNISDISALSGLTSLTNLYLYSNNISDISALSGLTSLTYLDLYSNNISDISVLSGLTSLTNLILISNNISDITALRTNCDAGGLGNGDYIYLQINPLSDQAKNVDIPYLQSKGVIVIY